jgi:predicted nucleic acid-binding protein
MRFWDSSALVPLLVRETEHGSARAEFERDPEIAAWWATAIECASALARREREEALSAEFVGAALRRLEALAAAWQEVQPTERVRRAAMRMLRVHPVRAADALQLAAAIVASEDNPATLPFVTFDDRLGRAAEREGFAVVRP